MSDRPILGAVALAAAVIAGFTGCRANAVDAPAARANSAAAAPGGSPVAPHGDHNPHHSGVVLMKGELHYEVVLDPRGRSHQVFFSDAVREELPASVASTVMLTIRRPGTSDESIPLQIDGAGESWIGTSSPVADEAKASVRVAFTIGGEPYFIDVPFTSRASIR